MPNKSKVQGCLLLGYECEFERVGVCASKQMRACMRKREHYCVFRPGVEVTEGKHGPEVARLHLTSPDKDARSYVIGLSADAS